MNMSVLSGAKDRLLERVALAYFNGKLLAPYGRATSLRINSTTKTMNVEVELKGETVPVKIEIKDYKISNDQGRYFAEVKRFRTSREWLTALAANHLSSRRFELPSELGRLLMRTL